MRNRLHLIDPFSSLAREVDRMFEHALRGWTLPDLRGKAGFPALAVEDAGDAIVLEAELPGVRPDDLDLEIRGRELTLKGRRERAEEGSATVRRRERGTGEFTRVVRLPLDVVADEVRAELEHGVLTVTLPKVERDMPRRIPVGATSEEA